jgi:hypothetical protein
MMRIACLLASLVLLAACQVDAPHFFLPVDAFASDGPSQPDAMPIDAEPACVANTVVCDDATSTYTDCASDGTPNLVMHCPLGCDAAQEKCVDVAPSNDLAAYLDQARDDDAAIAVSLSGSSTINAETGEVVTGATTVSVPTAVHNGIRVLMFKSLTVSGTVKVTAGTTNNDAVALVVDGDVLVQGTIDVSADGTNRGPAGGYAGDGRACSGTSFSSLTDSTPHPGAGGGGHFTTGASGGNSGDGDSGLVGGVVARDDDLVPLIGGCTGGGSSPLGTGGGAGGGAIQIVSRTTITLSSLGKIDASGGGGAGGAAGDLGKGGGAGGSILLEAPLVILNGASVVVSTKGGGGGAASGGPAGADGGTNGSAAIGGNSSTEADGGSGGTDTASPGSGGNAATNHDGGGGGGAVGQTRFNTRDGTISISSASILSQHTNALLATRLVPP